MKVEDFIQKLKELGFVDTGDRVSKDDFIRSYNPPERLAAAITSLNLGTGGESKYCVSLQPPEDGLVDKLGLSIWTDTVVIDGITYPSQELGTVLSPFMLNLNEELLDALHLDAESFLRWVYHRPIAVMSKTDEEGKESDFIVRGDSIEHLKPGPKL